MKSFRILLRLFRLSLNLGVVSGFKLAIAARLTKGLVKLWLAPCSFPLFTRGKTTDDTVFEQVFANKEYPILEDFNPRTIIDAGANCGAASAYFAAHYPKAEIVALEPESSNFEILTMNVGALRNVSLLPGALWSRKCWLKISKPDSVKYAFEVEEVLPPTEATCGLIAAYTVEDVLRMKGWPSVDLLKLDIEGSELQVFSRNIENWIGKVRVIFVELHEELAPGCGKALFTALGSRDYQVGVCGEHLVIRLSDENPSPAVGSLNQLRSHLKVSRG